MTMRFILQVAFWLALVAAFKGEPSFAQLTYAKAMAWATSTGCAP